MSMPHKHRLNFQRIMVFPGASLTDFRQVKPTAYWTQKKDHLGISKVATGSLPHQDRNAAN